MSAHTSSTAGSASPDHIDDVDDVDDVLDLIDRALAENDITPARDATAERFAALLDEHGLR